MTSLDRITSDPTLLNGRPCICRMRLTVRRRAEAVSIYRDRAEAMPEYLELEDEDTRQAQTFAAAMIDLHLRLLVVLSLGPLRTKRPRFLGCRMIGVLRQHVIENRQRALAEARFLEVLRQDHLRADPVGSLVFLRLLRGLRIGRRRRPGGTCRLADGHRGYGLRHLGFLILREPRLKRRQHPLLSLPLRVMGEVRGFPNILRQSRLDLGQGIVFRPPDVVGRVPVGGFHDLDPTPARQQPRLAAPSDVNPLPLPEVVDRQVFPDLPGHRAVLGHAFAPAAQGLQRLVLLGQCETQLPVGIPEAAGPRLELDRAHQIGHRHFILIQRAPEHADVVVKFRIPGRQDERGLIEQRREVVAREPTLILQPVLARKVVGHPVVLLGLLDQIMTALGVPRTLLKGNELTRLQTLQRDGEADPFHIRQLERDQTENLSILVAKGTA
ncbi:MAG: DUF433 domain-containing protein [Planctomycetes bacterium]|nr:DUF433 domain-containing protein [Planctomycetota bacterium]